MAVWCCAAMETAGCCCMAAGAKYLPWRDGQYLEPSYRALTVTYVHIIFKHTVLKMLIT